MKRTLLSLLLILSLCLLPTGCALFPKAATPADRTQQINSLCYAATSFGVTMAIQQVPDTRTKFLLAYSELNTLVTSRTVTGATLRAIIAGLPIAALEDGNARIYVDAATYLYDVALSDKVDLEKTPNLLAAATGIRDGMKVALGL